MAYQIGSKCPVCEEKFTEKDDIVVCPVCGAPYHRACYQKQGRCLFEERHGQGDAWEESRAQQEQKYDGAAPLRCPKCGTVNPPDGLFCQICGYRLRDESAFQQQEAEIPEPISPNAYTTPYGGVSPDEELSGVPVRELALYVGENSFYFIPHFKAIAQGARISGWSWPAFLFRGFYYLYRKRYGRGILLLLLTAALSLPGLLYSLCLFSGSPPAAETLFWLNRMQLVCSFLSLGLSAGCALFFNRGYFRSALRRIQKQQKKAGTDVWSPEYTLSLTKAGRTNRLLVVLLISGLFILSMLFSLWLSLSVW